MNQFDSFIQERTYLHNVSPRTVEWYRESFKHLDNEAPSASDLKSFVMKMRVKGLKASSCNNRIRAVNAYLKWSGSDLTIPKLKEEQRVLPTFAVDDITRIAKWKPGRQLRLQMIILTIADCGCRISEALALRWTDVDFDNVLLTLYGKGRKGRLVPFSYELRGRLWKYKQTVKSELVFPSRTGQKLGRRDVLRDVKALCRKLGIAIPERTVHALRHTFAVNYVRRGGSVFHLQKMLGHSSLTQSRVYANLSTADLSAVHENISLLRAA